MVRWVPPWTCGHDDRSCRPACASTAPAAIALVTRNLGVACSIGLGLGAGALGQNHAVELFVATVQCAGEHGLPLGGRHRTSAAVTKAARKRVKAIAAACAAGGNAPGRA